MSIYSVNTRSGGIIELLSFNDRFHGQQLILHADQSSNMKNGEGDCNMVISDDEVKDLIALLNGYLTQKIGIPYVILAEHLANPAVKIDIDEFAKNSSLDIDMVKKIIADSIESAINNPNNPLTKDDFILAK